MAQMIWNIMQTCLWVAEARCTRLSKSCEALRRCDLSFSILLLQSFLFVRSHHLNHFQFIFEKVLSIGNKLTFFDGTFLYGIILALILSSSIWLSCSVLVVKSIANISSLSLWFPNTQPMTVPVFLQLPSRVSPLSAIFLPLLPSWQWCQTNSFF